MGRSKLTRTTKLGSGIIKTPPTTSAIKAAMEFSDKSPQAADYLVTSFVDTIESHGKFMVEASQGMLKQLKEFRNLVHLQCETNGKAWTGEFIESMHQNLQGNLATQIAHELTHKIAADNILIDFAISSDSNIIRKFSSAGEKIIGEMESLLDKLLNAFLGLFGVKSDKSTLFAAREDGTIIVENGERKKADPDVVREKINNEFGKFIEELVLGTKVEVINWEHKADTAKKTEPTTPDVEAPASTTGSTKSR